MHCGRLANGSAHSAASCASQLFAQMNVGSFVSQTGDDASAVTVVDGPPGGVSFHDSGAPFVDATEKSNTTSPGLKSRGRACAVSAAKTFFLPYGIVTVSALSLR